MVYNIYPAVDNETYQFPPIIIQGLAATPELRSTIIPMTQTQRNDLSGLNLWDGRLVFNTTTSKINRYDLGTTTWYEIDSDNKVLRAGDTMTGPLILSGAPTQDLHASTKKYVDDTDVARKNYVDTYRPLSGRNLIINGDFSVNQRNSSSITANDSFIQDRWKQWLNGRTCTSSPLSITLGTLPINITTGISMVVAGASGTASLFTNLEDVTVTSNQEMTVSFYGSVASGTGEIELNTYQVFGTTGSPSASVDTYYPTKRVTLTTTWQRHTITFTMPSVVGKTLTTNHYLGVYLILRTTGTYRLTGIQLEMGSVATPFEQKTYADELRACQRYYWRTSPGDSTSPILGFGTGGTTTTAIILFNNPVQMRRVLTGFNYSGIALSDFASGNITVTGSTLSTNSTPNVSVVTLNVASGVTQFRPYGVRGLTNAAWCEFSAEL